MTKYSPISFVSESKSIFFIALLVYPSKARKETFLLTFFSLNDIVTASDLLKHSDKIITRMVLSTKDCRRRMNMILLADLGNRSLSLSLYENRKEITSFKTTADRLKSADEYTDIIKQFFRVQNVDATEIQGAILASVIPSLTKRIQKAISNAISKDCLLLNRKLKTGLAIRMDNPSEVGSNLLSASLGAVNNYKADCLIICLSSCVSFSIVTSDKQFIGGLLFPGMRESVNHMIDTNAQLMEIELNRPNKLIGKSTAACINNGVIKGYMAVIESLSIQLEQEFGKKLMRIITGPDASILKDYMPHDFRFDSHLLMDGLYDIYMKNHTQE